MASPYTRMTAPPPSTSTRPLRLTNGGACMSSPARSTGTVAEHTGWSIWRPSSLGRHRREYLHRRPGSTPTVFSKRCTPNTGEPSDAAHLVTHTPMGRSSSTLPNAPTDRDVARRVPRHGAQHSPTRRGTPFTPFTGTFRLSAIGPRRRSSLHRLPGLDIRFGVLASMKTMQAAIGGAAN